MASLCGPTWGRSEDQVMRMTRAYVFNVLACVRDKDDSPKIEPWAWEKG